MDEKIFKARTRKLAVAIIQEVNKLPNSRATDVIGKQLLRSGTSIGANYRAACRSKSFADMINKKEMWKKKAMKPNIGSNSWLKQGLYLKIKLPELTKKQTRSWQ